MKQFKNILFYIISFLIPVVILVILSGFNDIFPLGSYTLNVYDGSMQHPGFLSYLKGVILGYNSLFYSFKGALGYNFFATFIYYLASPLNLFSVFFKTEYLTIFYSIMVYIKIGLCGLTCFILLNYFKKRKTNLIFSTIYALIGYNLVYFSNYMWMDSVIMTPLVILGIEKLLKENKKIFYVISLTLCILFNFYIGFMVVIFSIIYFIYKTFSTKIEKNKIKSFIVLTLLSGLISCIFIIPVFFELLNGKASLYNHDIQTNYFEGSLDFIYAFYKSTVGSYYIKDISYGTPNIYCTLFVISLVFLFFFNKQIKTKEKVISAIIIGFYLLSFSFNLIDYAWHFFQRPIWFPNRYSFTFSLFLILIAFKSFNNLKGIAFNKKLIISFIFLLIIFVISFILKEVYNDKVTFFFAIFSLLLLSLYFLIFTNKTNNKIIYMSFIFLIIELSLNSFYTFKNIDFVNTTDYKIGESISFKKDLNIIKQRENGFYKLEFNDTTIHNNGALYNYNGINYFNSLRNGKVMYFLENILGMLVIDDCRITYNSFNPLTNTLLGIKYFEGNMEEDYYKKISDNNRVIYENDLVLPLAFLSNNNTIVNLTKGDYINNYEKIFNSFIENEQDFMEEFDISLNNVEFKDNYYYKVNNNSYIKYSKELKNNGWVIFSTKDNFKEYSPIIYKNGKQLEINYDRKTTFYFNKGDKIEIIFNIKKEKVNKNIVSIGFLNHDKFSDIVNEINDNKQDIKNYKKDNNLLFKVKTEEDTKLKTFIPYDKGWHVYVDGRKIKVKQYLDTFISVDLEKGSHEVKFVYIPRGLILGFIVSGISIILLVIYLKKSKRNLT